MDSGVHRLALSTGIAVPCLVAGNPSGRPLLLLHAWGESHRSFDRLVPMLRGFRVCAPDLRGHGDADKPAGGYSLVGQAGDASAVLDALGLASAAVLGSSSGGYVAQQLAVSDPQRVDALILVGAPLTLAGRPAFADEVEALADPISEEWVRQSVGWFPLHHPVPEWFVEDRISDGLKIPAAVWRASLQGFYRAAPPTDAGTVQAPTLILWGEQDGFLPFSSQELLAARIPRSALEACPGTGHLVLWECPELVAEQTTAFLLNS